VHVNVYDTARPGAIVVVGVFHIDNGDFVRELRPR
jgi:hypothetical protein